MNFPVLPFCKNGLSDFNFFLTQSIDINRKSLIVFKRFGYFLKISEEIETDNFLIFGNYKGKFCVIENVNYKDENFIHLMSKRFNDELRTIAGIGLSTLIWHEETKFCGKCGNNLEISTIEKNSKFCKNCNSFIYPRLNPAIIIAVKKDKNILVTQKEEWKSDRFGLIAGFIEYGESIEEAAEREVMEETGISIKNIKYIASQFWPFPYQLMIGLKADYESGEIIIEKNELSLAKWFPINKINEKILPPPTSIARFLFEYIIKGESP